MINDDLVIPLVNDYSISTHSHHIEIHCVVMFCFLIMFFVKHHHNRKTMYLHDVE